MEDPEARGPEILPCVDCPAGKLEEFLTGPYGQGIPVVIDLDFALQTGIRFTLAEIDYREFRLLRLLSDERNKYEIEQIEKKSNGR